MQIEDILLIMNKNSYSGREYLSKLQKKKLYVKIAEIGDHPTHDDFEDERCNYNWRPKLMSELLDFEINSFKSLDDTNFLKFLKRKKFKIGIQGGTGIIKRSIFKNFKLGILNFHPGDLPKYRGSTAPEWQVYDDKPVICTCHKIDDRIDSGPIYSKRKLNVSIENYFLFRSSIYPEISNYVVDVVSNLIDMKENKLDFVCQNEKDANYNRPIQKNEMQTIIKKFKN